MKTKILKSSIFIAIFGIALWSCNKSENLVSGKQFENPNENIGKEHNRLLPIVLENLDVSNKSQSINIINQRLKEINKSISEKENSSKAVNINEIIINYTSYKSPEDYFAEYSTLTNMESDDNDYENLSQAAKSEIQNVIEYVSEKDWNLNELTNYLTSQEQLLNGKNYNDFDKSSLFSYYATYRHSIEFWAPINQGGQGGLDNFISENNINTPEGWDNVNWWKTGGVDAIGALMGARGGWIGALIGCVGASAISVIMQY